MRWRSLGCVTYRRPLTLAALAAAGLAAAALAGCGGGGGGSRQASAPTATIGVGSTGVGDVLMDPQNHTLYLFQKDSAGKSTCFRACAHQWPPVRATAKPAAGTGARASLIGTIRRSDGPPQVTYNGHPLYLFAGDNTPSATNGQGVRSFGAAWFAVSPAGNPVTRRSTAGRSRGY
jgi:predicted lipoprotein with Yx(FWY)xxD motif